MELFEQKTVTKIEPVLLSVSDACKYAAISRSGLYRLLGAKKIRARKLASRTLIERESLDQFVKSLPLAA